LQDLTDVFRLQEKEFNRAVAKVEAYQDKGLKAGRSATELRESVEGKKLFKRLQVRWRLRGGGLKYVTHPRHLFVHRILKPISRLQM